jgi:hypothetical protein
MRLGPSIRVLALLERGTPSLLRPALTIGRVPLFYFVVHLTLIHALAVLACYLRYGEIHWMFESPRLDEYPVTQPPDWPLSLPLVYLWWIGVVVMFYPLFVWFSGLKQRRRDWWLSYLWPPARLLKEKSGAGLRPQKASADFEDWKDQKD